MVYSTRINDAFWGTNLTVEPEMIQKLISQCKFFVYSTRIVTSTYLIDVIIDDLKDDLIDALEMIFDETKKTQ